MKAKALHAMIKIGEQQRKNVELKVDPHAVMIKRRRIGKKPIKPPINICSILPNGRVGVSGFGFGVVNTTVVL